MGVAVPLARWVKGPSLESVNKGIDHERTALAIGDAMALPGAATDVRKITDVTTVPIAELSEPALREMERRYLMKAADLKPHVYYRLTDNWLEMTVRFIVEDLGIRAFKDAMARDILRDLDAAGIASRPLPSKSSACRRSGSKPLERSRNLQVNVPRLVRGKGRGVAPQLQTAEHATRSILLRQTPADPTGGRNGTRGAVCPGK